MKNFLMSFMACIMFFCALTFAGCSNNKYDDDIVVEQISAFQKLKSLCKENATELGTYKNYHSYEIFVAGKDYHYYSIKLFESRDERLDYIMFLYDATYSTHNQTAYFKIYENNYNCYTYTMIYSNVFNEHDFALCEFEPSLITRQTDLIDFETTRITEKEEPVDYKTAFLATINQINEYLKENNIKLADFGFTQYK